MDQPISSAAHPLWQWLAKRKGRISGLKVTVELDAGLNEQAAKAEQPAWESVLQTFSSIPDLDLTVSWVGGCVSSQGHPYISQWLEQYKQHINHLNANVESSTRKLTSRAFCDAAASCRSLQLNLYMRSLWLGLRSFAPVSMSLVGLQMTGLGERCQLRNLGNLTCFTQLTTLSLSVLNLRDEDLWTPLASLTGLTHLSVKVAASGDPSLLSALTGLRSLRLVSREAPGGAVVRFSMSSMQPFSTLHQLEMLELEHCCLSTSFEGLAELSRLTGLNVGYARSLTSVKGLSTAIRSLNIHRAYDLACLQGIEGLVALEELSLSFCRVACLRLLAGLGSLRGLSVCQCSINSLEGLGGSLGTCLQELALRGLSLDDLSGLGRLSALQQLTAVDCGVTNWQPLAELRSGLKVLKIGEIGIREHVLELPHVLPTASVEVMSGCTCDVREVVLTGGVRRAVGHYF